MFYMGNLKLKSKCRDDSTVIEPQNIEALEDYTSAIQNVLRSPTGSKPLKELVNKDDIVSIVISDITRPTPNHILVPYSLKN